MDLKYLTKEQQDKITHSIIGCAMEVHNILGNGFQEVVYQRALSIEMNLRNIEYQREFEMPLSYKGFDIGSRRVDFLVMKEISIEIKAIINQSPSISGKYPNKGPSILLDNGIFI